MSAYAEYYASQYKIVDQPTDRNEYFSLLDKFRERLVIHTRIQGKPVLKIKLTDEEIIQDRKDRGLVSIEIPPKDYFPHGDCFCYCKCDPTNPRLASCDKEDMTCSKCHGIVLFD